MIGASRSQNNDNTSYWKECETYSAGEPVHDEGDDSIVSHQKFMILVQSRLGWEEGQKTMVDNGSVASPEKVNIVTKHTHNTTNTPSKNSFDKE